MNMKMHQYSCDLGIHSINLTLHPCVCARSEYVSHYTTTITNQACIHMNTPMHESTNPNNPLPFPVQCQHLTAMAACFHKQYAQLHA